MVDYPHVTVAVVVQRQQRYLLVREQSACGEEVFNQPAGHLELGETLSSAALRETFEETGWRVRLQAFLGVSQYYADANGVTYIRISFVAEALQHEPLARLDEGIIAAEWLTWQEIRSLSNLRSPMVLEDIERLRRGNIYPLSVLNEVSVGPGATNSNDSNG